MNCIACGSTNLVEGSILDEYGFTFKPVKFQCGEPRSTSVFGKFPLTVVSIAVICILTSILLMKIKVVTLNLKDNSLIY